MGAVKSVMNDTDDSLVRARLRVRLPIRSRELPLGRLSVAALVILEKCEGLSNKVATRLGSVISLPRGLALTEKLSETLKMIKLKPVGMNWGKQLKHKCAAATGRPLARATGARLLGKFTTP